MAGHSNDFVLDFETNLFQDVEPVQFVQEKPRPAEYETRQQYFQGLEPEPSQQFDSEEDIKSEDSSWDEEDEQEGEEEDWQRDSTAWLTRAREKTAKSSQKSRRKRKQEEETVYKENERLKKERAQCLQVIHDLEESIRKEREVRGNPITLEMENEILRTQLQEHRRFIDKYMLMVKTIPEGDSLVNKAVSAVSKSEAELIESCMASLVADSVNWTPLRMSGKYFRYLKPKETISGCYKLSKTSNGSDKLHVRIDLVLPNAAADVVAKMYWQSLTDGNTFRYFFLGHPEVQKSASEYDFKWDRIPLENKDELRPLLEEIKLQAINDDGEMFAIKYHESRPPPDVDRLSHFVCTTRTIETARSTLLLPAKLSPKLAQHISASSQRVGNCGYGKTKAAIMVRTRATAIPPFEIEKQSIANAHLQSNLRLDGALVWEEENVVDKEIVSCTRWAAIIEIQNGVGIQVLENITDMVSPTGALGARFCLATDKFAELCCGIKNAESLKYPTVFEKELLSRS